jgi:hypothetical protein
MFATVATWLATQGASLALGFLATLIKDWWATNQANQAQRDAGRAQQANEARAQADADLARSDAATRAAASKHAADPTDAAFDDQFRRPS